MPAKIYLSSTYNDLLKAREAVYRALRRLGHDVIAMEDYVATDERPVDKCLGDVGNSDIYLGIIAWRYGYIPSHQISSITELEFREAVRLDKPCLLFLLDEEAPWPRALIDRDAQPIDAIREEMKRNYTVSFFRTDDELASLASAAVTNLLRRETEFSSISTLQIADLVISEPKSPHPVIDIKLFNPSSTVAFLTDIVALVLESRPFAGLVKPSAEYDLLIEDNRNVLKVSHEIRPNSTERIIVRLSAAPRYLACAIRLALELIYNGGEVLKAPSFDVEFVEGGSTGLSDAIRPPNLNPIYVENDPDLAKVFTTKLWVRSEIDTDIFVDGQLQMSVDHGSGFDSANATVSASLDSVVTVKAREILRSIRFRDFSLPGSQECKLHIGTKETSNVRITEEEKRAAIGNSSDVPDIVQELVVNTQYSRRAWAAKRLGYIGDKAATDPLLKAAQGDPDPYVQAQAAYALGLIGETSVMPELEKAYRAYSSKPRWGWMFEAALQRLNELKMHTSH
jgi:hypothetical protein